jgi:opacity protein-like surface antigen
LMQPIGIRLDGAYNRFNGESDAADVAITSGTLNLTYRLPVTNSPISPYVIAGAGAYRAECVGDSDCGSTTKFGWNAGLGTKFVMIGLHGFLESRFHATETGSAHARYIPVTLGLTL